MSKRLRKRYGCPVELAVDVLGGKWKTVILARIKEGRSTYGELRKSIPELSDKVLSQKLKELIELGLIERTATAEDASRNCYRLSSRGHELAPALNALYAAGSVLAGPLSVAFSDDARAS